ncbi:MAG: 50S ribosomal protein L32e [Candidatus Bathyarchaeia archaeon]
MAERTAKEKGGAREAVKLRQAVKAGKPKFRTHESWRYKRVSESWRKPRGLDNKMRLKVKGWPKSVNVGYGGPRAARGLHPSGYAEAMVHTPDEVADVNPETQVIRIAHTVGTRKRIQITSMAKEKGVRVLNPLVRRAEEEKIEEEEMPEEIPEEAAAPEEPESDTEPKKKPKRSRRTKSKKGGQEQ